MNNPLLATRSATAIPGPAPEPDAPRRPPIRHGLVPLLLGGIALLTATTTVAQLPTVFQLDQGYLNGFVAAPASEGHNTVFGFLGLPYAAPPEGDLRWRPPQPPERFPIVPYEAVTPGPRCMQTDYPEGSFFPNHPEETSEDCLYLNIWSAADSPNDRRPVMVWIHGGALTRGSGANSVYDGTALAKKGAVVVTINYRLNVFGFFAHPALTSESRRIVGEGGALGSSGNYGLLDQVAALRWVRNNIAAFGGDPDNVTIFGESAGSWSVNALQATPLAKGLFHRAIGQSGGVFQPMNPLSAPASSEIDSGHAAGLAFAKQLGIEDPSAEGLAALRAVPARKLLEEASKPRAFATSAVVDGWVFPAEIRDIFAAGRQSDVPVMIGSNADEMTSLGGTRFNPPNVTTFESLVKMQLGDDDRSQKVLDAYRPTDDSGAQAALLAVLRDEIFTRQMRLWARGMESVDSEAYLYYFTRAPMHPERDVYGAYHAAEIAYVFGNLDAVPYEHGEVDRRLERQMSELWFRFARDGRPSADGVPTWPPYSAGEQHLELGDQLRIADGLCKPGCDALDGAAAPEGDEMQATSQ